ncbi:MAG: NAD(P)-binding protein [Desulfosalsimonadaceae bacterium]
MPKNQCAPVSVVGGNIAGLSAAWHLARLGIAVTVYESQIWNKPCGGAISCEFAGYLQQELGVAPEGADHFVPGLRLSFAKNRVLDLPGFFVVTNRKDLQQKLIRRLRREPNINFVFRRVSISDHHLFSPQTVLAAGFSGFSKQAMQEHWQQMRRGIIYRFDGRVAKGPHPRRHLMVFDSRIKGYGWIFIGKDDHVNIGFGGLAAKERIRQCYEDFLEHIVRCHGYYLRPPDPTPEGWKIPVVTRNWNYPVAFARNGVEFIGTGDALGLAHPVIGAGIEPAWQSGWLLAQCADAQTGIINTEEYRRLLKHNLRLTCRSPVQRLMTATAKSRGLPCKDVFGYLTARLTADHIIRTIQNYPWFAMVHDGRRKTGYSISVPGSLRRTPPAKPPESAAESR